MSPPAPAHAHGSSDALTEREQFWRDRYVWLKEAGYELRPRYNPDWIPSWRTGRRPKVLCEDYVKMGMQRTLDAVRVKDGSTVMIKRVHKSVHPYESAIGLYLCSPPLDSDPRNHCCPTLEVLEDPFDNDVQYIVMPLLRKFNEPKLATVGEAVEFFRQTFEGLQFMHEHHVAHRDIMPLNVMMDSRPILPRGYHPQAIRRTRDFKHWVTPRSRTAHPVKYYFIDFGLSRRYSAEEKNPLELPILGGDKSVPEFQNDKTTPRNPFHTDVYYMGNLIRTQFLQMYTNLTFMKGLVERMVHDDPTQRPTMEEVVQLFKDIMSRLSNFRLRERLIEPQDDPTMNFFKEVHHFTTRTLPFVLTRRPAIPTPKAR